MNMKIRCCDFSKFESEIKNNGKRMVLWGTGLIGGIIAPEILEQHNLINDIDCYLDNDESKWKEYISVKGRNIQILPPNYLRELDDNTVLIITTSRFSEVVRQAEELLGSLNMDCYILPMLLIHNYCVDVSKGQPILSKEIQIPKKLHYVWLGEKTIPRHIQKCIDSWKRLCPDYEIIEWNESNYDVSKNPYMKEAYEAGAYGFVPDYARLDILYQHGGIYLDTDVELIRNLDPLLNQKCFCCLEKWQDISFGGCAGSIPGHPTIKRFIDAREKIHFINSDGTQNRNTCGYYDTQTALEMGYRINGETQTIEEMNVFAYDYFLPYDYMTGKMVKTEHTYSVHWYNGGWMTEEMKLANENVMSEYERIYIEALANE